MCGIFGIVRQDGGKPDEDVVRSATDSMVHRGPDASGYFFFNNVAIGNRRLAIFDIDTRADQPMHFEGLVITFNGALYNYLELREQLKGKGYNFKTNSDTEVVLAAYKHWGERCVSRFNGMWSFAILDPTKQLLFCSRDRFGIKPFFYTEFDKKLIFASEIKALAKVPGWKPSLNRTTAAAYLNEGLHFQGKETLYQHVFSLSAGCNLTINLSDGQFVINSYFNLENFKVDTTMKFSKAKDQFRSLLKSSVEMHSRSDVSYGAAISGGLDSTSLVAILSEQKNGDKKLNTISYSSSVPEFDESKYAKLVVEKFNTNAHWTSADFKQTMEYMDEVIHAHDGPLLSASLIAQYLVFKKAKEQGIKVMIDGQGADELMAGYGTYYSSYLLYVIRNNPWSFPYEAIEVLRKHSISFEKIKKVLSINKSNPNFFNFEKGPTNLVPPDFLGYEKYMMTVGILPYLLQYEDRNSMAHGVESRVPFLDHRLVEFCLKLPPSFKIKNGVRKRLLRESMKAELPKEIYNRYDKMGFSTPQTVWMSENPDYFLGHLEKYCADYPKLINKNILTYAKEGLSNKSVEVCNLVWRTCSFFRWVEINGVVC